MTGLLHFSRKIITLKYAMLFIIVSNKQSPDHSPELLDEKSLAHYCLHHRTAFRNNCFFRCIPRSRGAAGEIPGRKVS
jgi:hypothetical protein